MLIRENVFNVKKENVNVQEKIEIFHKIVNVILNILSLFKHKNVY
jgi:hypothetical protein